MKELINQRDAEGRPHGLWEHYRPDGTLGYRVHFHHGRRHGLWEHYWSNGTLWWRTHWHQGEKKGLEMEWDSQGRIASKMYNLVIR